MNKEQIPPSHADIPSYTIPMLTARSDEQGYSISGPLFRHTLIAKTGTVMDAFHVPSRIDAIVVGICTQGECRIVSDLHDHTLTEGQLFIVSPRNVFHIRSKRNFRADILAVSPELMQQIRFNIQYMVPLIIHIGSQQFFNLSEENIRALHNLIGEIESEIQVASETHFTAEIVRGLISATLYKFGDILTRHIERQPELQNAPGDRAESYFRHFIRLLSEHYKQERSVGFYARQMCITPKYLTTIIKRISQKSVSEWIDQFVVPEAKTLLKYSEMSVQEIAYYLNFPNQSFFGSYFKRNTGMSPTQYRNR